MLLFDMIPNSDSQPRVSYCVLKPRVRRSFYLSILVSGLEAGDISAGSDTVDLLHISILYLLSGIREGGDIRAGSAAVRWSPGSRGLLRLSILVSVVRNTRER